MVYTKLIQGFKGYYLYRDNISSGIIFLVIIFLVGYFLWDNISSDNISCGEIISSGIIFLVG